MILLYKKWDRILKDRSLRKFYEKTVVKTFYFNKNTRWDISKSQKQSTNSVNLLNKYQNLCFKNLKLN